MRLNDSVIVVTGGASGLGRAMVRGFAAEGARVACVDVHAERLRQTVAEVEDEPGETVAVNADVRSWEEVQSAMETAREALGPVDVLINNAAVTQRIVTGGEERRPVADLSVDVWDAVLETNLRGPFLCTRAVLPDMLTAGSGRLVHISSTMARTGRARFAPYVTSKFGLEGLCQCLAEELAGTGVESITLRPPDGAVYTQTRDYLPGDERDRRHSPDVITEAAVQLAAGSGSHGGRYVATVAGDGYDLDD